MCDRLLHSDWRPVAQIISPEGSNADRLLDALAQFAEALAEAPKLAAELGVDGELIETAMARCAELVKSVRERHIEGASQHGSFQKT